MLKDSVCVLPRPENEMIGRHPIWLGLVSFRGAEPQPTDASEAKKRAQRRCGLWVEIIAAMRSEGAPTHRAFHVTDLHRLNSTSFAPGESQASAQVWVSPQELVETGSRSKYMKKDMLQG